MSIAKKSNPFRGLAVKEKVQYESYPYVGYRIRRGQQTKTIKISSLGFRGDEIDTTRDLVICLGNSTLFGSGLPDTETITDILNARFPKYHFLNAGMSGYLINQELNLLIMLLKDLSPRYVLLLDGFTECFFAYYNKDLNKTPYFYDLEFAKRTKKNVWSRIRHVCGLMKKKNHDYPPPAPADLVENYLYHFSLVSALGQSLGFRAISFIQPTSYYSLRESKSSGRNDCWTKVRKIEKQYPGFTEYVHDTYVRFKQASNGVDNLVFLGDLFGADMDDKYLDGTHYTYRGGIEIAAAIGAELDRCETGADVCQMQGFAPTYSLRGSQQDRDVTQRSA